MSAPLSERQAKLRSLVTGFLQDRLSGKLAKLEPDDPGRAELREQFDPANWLPDAARRAGQIQAVTHSLKPTHPDAKGTNLYSPPHGLPGRYVVGSHCLGENFASDVVGNAAALDVYRFLRLSHQNRSLLDLALERDADLAAALTDDDAQAQAWLTAFAGLVEPRGRLASHTFAKQVYWMAGETLDPYDDRSFHLLAPLYASSLAHRVFLSIQDDRFGEQAKAARQARREDSYSDRPVHEYPQLAVQKLGGTKPQNISQLNSERRGDNYLLASLPPAWISASVKPLHHTESMFYRFGRRAEVRRLVKTLLDFLKADPKRNKPTRDYRAALVDDLTDQLLQFRDELQVLPPGWSQQPECQLGNAQRHWLDPEGVEAAYEASGEAVPTDTAEQITRAFGNWLNGRLRGALPVGDPEFDEWRRRMLEAIKADERGERDANE